jgi:CRP/FNR family cyclic AMP-dependent transcriptional regulator
MAKDRSSIFRLFDILRDVPDEALRDLSKSCAWHQAPAGRQIFHANQASSEVYFVTAGRVRVLLHSAAEGRLILFAELGPNQMFGEVAAIDGSPRSATVEAIEDCALAILPKDQFHRLIHQHPAFACAVMRQVVSHVRRLTERVHELSALSVESRIHVELLRLAELAGGKDDQALIAPMPKRIELAARVATAPEAVSRVVTRLKKEGIAKREPSGLRILSVARLRKHVLKAKGE